MKKVLIAGIILGIVTVLFIQQVFDDSPVAAKIVTVKSRNLKHQVATNANTFGEFLAEQKISSEDYSDADKLGHGMTVTVSLPVFVTLIDGGDQEIIETRSETVADFIYEQQIALALTDRVSPSETTFLGQNMQIIIDRIVDLEITETNGIPYRGERKHDPEVLYGREELLINGEKGVKEEKFLITYVNGVETKRQLLQSAVLKEPVTEVRVIGTKIEVEHTGEGRASWYAYRGCMCAAHPFYPFGRFVRVTATATGKSIIVRVNDRGPDQTIHPDRVIDLDSVPFKELASLGTGTIGVKVELIK